MRPHPLDWVIASGHLGNDGVVIIGVKPSAIAYLSTGFGVEGCVIEDDLALLAGFELSYPLTALADDRQNFTVIGTSLAIPFKLGFRELLIDGVGGLLGRAFPGGASAGALLLHRMIKSFLIECDTLVASRILHKIQRESEGVVQLESILTRVNRFGSTLAAIPHSAKILFKPAQSKIERVRKASL